MRISKRSIPASLACTDRIRLSAHEIAMSNMHDFIVSIGSSDRNETTSFLLPWNPTSRRCITVIASPDARQAMMVYPLLERSVRTDGSVYSLGSVLHFCTYQVNYTIRSHCGNTPAFCEKFQHTQIIGVVLNWRTESSSGAGRACPAATMQANTQYVRDHHTAR